MYEIWKYENWNIFHTSNYNVLPKFTFTLTIYQLSTMTLKRLQAYCIGQNFNIGDSPA